MRKKTREIKEKEKRLLYYLELCRELQTRENARQALAYFEEEVDRLVEDLESFEKKEVK